MAGHSGRPHCGRADGHAQLRTRGRFGANVALLFSVGLIAWRSHLDEERIVRTEAWRALAPEERPAGEAGRRWALNSFEELALRFARASSAVAIVLAGTRARDVG